MKSTHHSEYLKLRSVFIKPVKNAFISDIHISEQWRDLNYLSRPDFDTSIEEYEIFENILVNAYVEIHHFEIDPKVTIDSIYCRDAAIATDFGIILCNMGKSGRVNEPQAHKQTYIDANMSILGEIKSPGTLEGGDVAWLDEKTLAVGYSYRTNKEGIKQLKELLEPKGIEVIVVELPHYKGPDDVFHLMSILSPIDKNLAVIYSPLMPIKFRYELKNRGFSFVEVPENEFESMGCNVLAIGPRKCIIVEGNLQTEERLKKAGCAVLTYKGEHISVKGGGGPTCLTLPLLRTY